MKDEIDRYLINIATYNLYTDYHFGGYAKTNIKLLSFIKTFVADTGILIEPVYTGKMLYAIYDLAAKGHFKSGSKILAIHTGGLIGLLGMKDKFQL